MASVKRILTWTMKDISHAYRPLPLPPAGAFAGQTVCVVGSSTGLGFAAAQHCLTLGASELIITSRDSAKAAGAKKRLEEAAAAIGAECRVTVMVLDMNRFASVVAFANDLKKVGAGRGGVDFLLLNAAVIQSDFVQSPEGWQEELQVNTLSNVLLALLLLPWMKEERKNRSAPAHLAITTSSGALLNDISQWESWSQSGEGVLKHWNKKENWPTGLSGGYTVSKTLLMFATLKFTKFAVGADGR
jgi:NAD(P)-dependent dehydrogenase (short-subunit alcohol dehydrogenase family)